MPKLSSLRSSTVACPPSLSLCWRMSDVFLIAFCLLHAFLNCEVEDVLDFIFSVVPFGLLAWRLASVDDGCTSLPFSGPFVSTSKVALAFHPWRNRASNIFFFCYTIKIFFRYTIELFFLWHCLPLSIKLFSFFESFQGRSSWMRACCVALFLGFWQPFENRALGCWHVKAAWR